MKKILAFAGSTSSTSINKQLAIFAAQNLDKITFDVIDLRDYQLPIYSTDEEQNGVPKEAQKFSSLLDNYDGFILSLAEHNGSYTAAFKNIFDWSSRVEKKVFRDKPLLLMATSPGGRGGATVLKSAAASFPHMGANSITTFSLPNFYDNFKDGKIVNEDLVKELKNKVNQFEKLLN
ncbi:NADPH-dependent FMN reductase [uncultured Polaribacter sp.]|uniref:NADPH-dependent FMN reductase n=1 Tax=uncultured Polaribacter sp. TaxID=174711 RepID=UPI002626BAA9|nr:NAD(P)H-dependent oxidoreductase [uncultured Polaribacter sp.]